MGIFKKQTANIFDETIKRINDRNIISYLKDVKNKKIKNEFMNDNLLCIVALELESLNIYERDKYGIAMGIIMKSLASFYNQIAPLGEYSNDADKLKMLFLKMAFSNKSYHDYFNKDFYNLFASKDTYLDVMDYMMSNSILLNKADEIHSYARNNACYFTDQISFKTHLISIMGEICAKNDFTAKMARDWTAENKKRVGIYSVDEKALQRIDDKLNSANSVVGVLENKMEEARLIGVSLETRMKEINDLVTSLIKETTNQLSIAARNSIADFELKYNEYLLKEKNSLTAQKDTLIREMIVDFEKRIGQLSGISDSISKNTIVEIKRVHDEGNEILSRIKTLVKDSPELQKTLAEYQNNATFISSVAKVEELMAKLSGGATGIINSNSSDKQPVVEVIPAPSYYLNNSVVYAERYKVLMEKKEKLMAEGHFFHEKFDDVLTFIIENRNPYLWGPSGCGKTYMLKQISNFLEIPLYDLGKINESYDVTGTVNIRGEYSRPLFFQAYMGGGLALADEIDASHPDATIIFNNFTRGGKSYNFQHYGVVNRHPDFRFVAAGNTPGNGADETFNGRLKLEESLQQRLIPVFVDYDRKVDQSIFTGKYEDWYLFSELFRKATSQYSKEKLDGSVAPGIFTTADAQHVKEYLDNESLNDEKIIRYEFVQNKSNDYLNYLSNNIKNYVSSVSNAKTLELANIFVKEVSSRKAR